MTRKPPRWKRRSTSSEITLYHFPRVDVRLSQQPKGHWSWRVYVGVQGVAMGDSAGQREAEEAGIGKVRAMLKEIERNCPWPKL